MILRSETDKLFRQLENTRTSLIWADSSRRGFPERVGVLQQSCRADSNVAEIQRDQEALLTEMTNSTLQSSMNA